MFSGLLIFEGFVSKPFRRVVFREGGRNTAPPPRPSGCTAVSVFLEIGVDGVSVYPNNPGRGRQVFGKALKNFIPFVWA